jgi:predicted PurR-regulated permease PerM
LKSKSDSISASQLAPVGDALKALIGGTVSAFGAVFGALIVPILAVYLLADFDRMISGARELVPLRLRESVESVAGEIDHTLSQFMRGQLTVMLILAVLYGGSYWLLGVRLAIPIGIAAGVLNFVPYVGGAFAVVAGISMSLIGGGGIAQIAGVVIAYVVVQTLEGFVITPRIVGESVGLREIWVLLALFVGGEVFGFLGVLLAVPAAAVLKIFVSRALAHYRESLVFLGPADGIIPALAVPPDEPDEPDEPDRPDRPDRPDEPDKPDEPDRPDEPDEAPAAPVADEPEEVETLGAGADAPKPDSSGGGSSGPDEPPL